MAFQYANTLQPLDAVDDVINEPPPSIQQPPKKPLSQPLPLRPSSLSNGHNTRYLDAQPTPDQSRLVSEYSPHDSAVVLCDELFREYDIRGTYPQQLDPQAAYYIGLSIGSALRQAQSAKTNQASQTINKDTTCLVGRDGRLSSPILSQALIQGLRQSGCSVIDLGMIPTPLMYFALRRYHLNHALMVTGSHNPADDNGIKIVLEQSC
ncbi:MAG TPA: hypothetical protein ENK78_05990, partial [Thiothrix sp.]|nr:hypothetical protein [Thiothrix sp.]